MQKVNAQDSTLVRLLKKRESVLVLILIIMGAAMGILSDSFLTMKNQMNVFRTMSMTVIIAIGEVFVLTSGGIDLSVGYIVASAGVALAAVYNGTGSPLLALLTALAIGVAVGVINGLLVTKGRIVPFIATLGTQQILKGLTVFLTNAKPITFTNDFLLSIGQGYFFDIPIPVIIMLALLALYFVVFNCTVFGARVQAIGGNAEASRISGINIELNLVITYVLSGLLAALSGIIMCCRIATGSPESGIGWEINAVSAAVIGGTSMSGGIGSIAGALLGAAVINFLNNGMVMLKISSNLQPVITGILLIAVVLSDNLKHSNKTS